MHEEAQKDILDKVLERIRRLDRTNQVVKVHEATTMQGGCSDVYCAKLITHGNTLRVAIKRIRASLYEDKVFAKVCKLNSPSQNLFNNIFSELCERTSYMGEVRTY